MQTYKYLPAERISFLQDGLLRFSPPGALNDPFELLPGITQAVIDEVRVHMKRELLTPPPIRPGMSRNERRVANRDYQKRATEVFHKIDVNGFVEAFYER